MVVSAGVDEACSLLQTIRVRLVLVHLEPDYVGYEELDHILWVISTLSRRVPVVVIAERYLVEQATTLYRMGVSDYVSRSHHLDQLGGIAAAYLPRRPEAAGAAETAPGPEKPGKVAASARASAAMSARVI
jgi:hypothetical protein